MTGIVEMKTMNPKDKEQPTQNEAFEIAADAFWQLLGMGYSLAEGVDMMKGSCGLTPDPATLRSYLRQARAANNAAAVKTPAKRRGRKAKPMTVEMDSATVNDESAADRECD